jgi:serralysin
LTPAHMALLADRRWAPGRTLRVRFLDGTKAQKSTLMGFADEWSRWANITFRQVTRGDAEIRASFRPGTGSWSYLGTDSLMLPQSNPTLTIGWDPDPATCLHELGHALGCVHEHQLPTGGIPWNRPYVYWWYQQTQGWTRKMVDEQVFALYDARTLTNGFRYDPRSVMHYPLDPVLLTDPSRAVGWNSRLSPNDKSYIGLIYPKGVRAPKARPVAAAAC